jgi:hypothetical protein
MKEKKSKFVMVSGAKRPALVLTYFLVLGGSAFWNRSTGLIETPFFGLLYFFV